MRMLELERVSTAYGRVPMLRDLDLAVEEGEIVALLGPNGAGKTTTFRAITGLVRPTAGRVRLMGRDLAEVGTERIAGLGVGLVPEGRRLFPDVSVLDNIRLGFEAVGGREPFEDALERVAALFPRVRERLRQAAGTLSGGEQAMVALARALVARPRLLIMDEPSLGLSPRLIDEYFEIVTDIAGRGTTVLLIEQNAEMVLRIAHRAYLLVKGRVVASGPAADLARSDAARQLYF
ncbi:MAG TPA: ABC transporter ATP-binding protein [Beijerinckiaceae bacterium]|nr:ABC transporter ATP-binding protein [Beijerinckiaceae bacterium]